jgi:transcriptional regulator with XRE-family HTH domain
MYNFGEFVQKIRLQNRITLREFCRQTGIDPSNWSKMERGVLQPPKSQNVLNEIAKVLKIKKNSEEWHTLMDLAAISFLPKNLITDQNIIEKLPVFFRTLRGDRPSRKELEELIKTIKED